MNRILLSVTLFVLGCTTVIEAQTPFPCGTIGGRSEWLKAYQANPDAYTKNLDTLLYVPLTIHMVGTDAGTGHFSVRSLLAAMCRLNDDFAESNIQFYVAGDIRYYNNSSWYNHNTTIEGGYMMLENNVDSTINIYFVNSPAGNCGYNLPYAGIAMNKGCSGPNAHTFAHELGHALSVQHPFLGWEGGISYDGSIPPNYNQPAPTFVTYDYTNFKDTLYLDTLIIDTALVELVDGSNCDIAADGFCDTSPDYLAAGWNCNANDVSSTVQTDPNGETFQSDGSLIMNYANDNCQARFTPEQIGAMRANLYDEKPEMLLDQSAPDPITATTLSQFSPLPGEAVSPVEVYFEWEAIAGAENYVIEISLLPNFPAAITEEYVTEEPSYLLTTGLLEEKTYHWRVYAYNSHFLCPAESGTTSFLTSTATSVDQIADNQPIRIFPNPVSGEQRISITAQAEMRSFQLTDLSGKSFELRSVINTGTEYRIDLPQLSSGVYLLRWEDNFGIKATRLVVQ